MLAYGFIKLSILYFYRRIFVPNRGTIMDTITRMSIVIVILWTVTFVLIAVFGCKANFMLNWASLATQLQRCAVGLKAKFWTVVTDLIIDVYLIILPLPAVSFHSISSW